MKKRLRYVLWGFALLLGELPGVGQPGVGQPVVKPLAAQSEAMMLQPAIAESVLQPKITVGVESLITGSNGLPFWLSHNRYGRYTQTGTAIGYAEACLTGGQSLRRLTLTYEAGIEAITARTGSDLKLHLVARVHNRWLLLQAGTLREPMAYNGLSSTNGNLVRSVNFRPYPAIALSTNGYLPLGITNNRVQISAEYREGVLNDNRMVAHARLHHKSLYAKYNPHPNAGAGLTFTAGIDHFVMWGGRSERQGRLPQGFSDYLRYITGSKGDEGFVEGDQINVAGNQLGAYHLGASKSGRNFVLQLYLSHPFEDRSGMELDNWRDNLYGIFLQRHKPNALLRSVLYEYTHTKQQSGASHNTTGPKKERMRGLDNYFNHGLYRSGFSYQGYGMGTPLIGPLLYDKSGRSIGFSNNRIAAHHLGAEGALGKALSWRAMATYSRNFMCYATPPPEKYRQQLSALAAVSWQTPLKNWRLTGRIAADRGALLPRAWGASLTVQRTCK